MTITIEQLQSIFKNNGQISTWLISLNEILTKYEINTNLRVAAFLAQTGFESSQYNILQENLNYSAKGLLLTFPTHFNKEQSIQYARQPEKIANHVYANRMGNGDETSGDGWKFRGRGLIMITGKDNYSSFSQDTYKDNCIVDNPDLLISQGPALMGACWFWNKNNLNTLADQSNFTEITKKINGGLNGLPQREALYKTALSILK